VDLVWIRIYFFSSRVDSWLIASVSIFRPSISSNFGDSILMNCSASFGILNVIVLPLTS